VTANFSLPTIRVRCSTPDSEEEWSANIQRQNFGPIHSKGYVSLITVREGDVWKKRMQMSNNQVGLAISFAVPAFAQQKDTVDPQIIEQLDALGKKFDEAWNNNDAAALAALYTEDAVLVTDTGPVYGREDIQKHYSDLRFAAEITPTRFRNSTRRLTRAERAFAVMANGTFCSS
jgi:hypothetical protein